MRKKQQCVLLIILLAAILLTACTPVPEPHIVVVTRIVTAAPAEVSAAEILQEVEVTRIVERPVEVTRIVEMPVRVTRLMVVTATPEPTQTPTATPEVSAITADAVLDALVNAGLPIGDSITYTEETDPNNMMGTASGYTSKVNFRDTRLDIQFPNQLDTIDGGSIEVYPTADGATIRSEYLTLLGAASPLFTEYHIQDWNILLRLSGRLTPEEVSEYETAMGNLN